MSSNIIYPHGGVGVKITVPATESIAVYTEDVAKVYREVGYPDVPATLSLLGTVTGGETVFGSYTNGATIVIEPGASPVLYQVGSAPLVMEKHSGGIIQPSPAAVNVTATLTIANLLAGIITSTTAAAVTGTLPTGTLCDAGSEFDVDEAFDWTVINTGGANGFTVAAGTGHTVVGLMVVAASTVGRFRTRKTAANTFVTYRLAS